MSKLARYQDQIKELRSERRQLAGQVAELGQRHNPSVLRRFVGVAIRDGAAYGGTRLYVFMMQKGWAPQTVPLDLLVGFAGQATTAFFEGPISSLFADLFDGVAEGSLGRLATMHQLQEAEVGGKICLLVPIAPVAANGNGNGNGG